MSSDITPYLMGATILSVGLSATIRVTQPPYGNGVFFKISSGGGTLAIVQGISSLATQGYFLAATDVVSITGPAVFYLAAVGATMNVAICQKYSQGALGT